ncbi:hypothetical protein L9F63_001433 [Diploptera punctata]|uniref:Uncharacterized protein n=1 Tax=Diploptera punctata TaxID=6984 RepID=A0AAD8A3X9_DIPPU|nr:hypothetical protein L9F63_001433 [Diploptera punctata]
MTNLMSQLSKYQKAENEVHEVMKLQLQLSEHQGLGNPIPSTLCQLMLCRLEEPFFLPSSELDKVKYDYKQLQEELLAVKQQSIEEKLKAIDQHSEEYIRWHDKAMTRVRQEADQQLHTLRADFSVKLEQKEKECTDLKQLYIEVYNTKEKLLSSLEQEQQKNREFTKQLNIESKKFQDAQLEFIGVEKQELTKRDLNEQLQNSKTLAREVEKAKLETLLFLYNRQARPIVSDVATSPLKNETTKEEDISSMLKKLEMQHQEEMTKILTKLEAEHQEKIEKVKQESVQCLANELSVCETRHRRQLEQAEEEYSRNLATFRSLIDNKTREVEVLKKAMLEERDKLRAEREHSQISEELKSRDREIKQLEEHLKLWEKDFQEKMNAQSDEWKNKLTTYQKEVEEERNNMAQAIAGWAKELQTLQKQYQESEEKISELQKKYQSAKKTAYRYKEWADGKEKHVEQEWHRISLAFQNALEALHVKALAEGKSTTAKQIESELQDLQNKMTLENPR